jgi:hypothetical protein
MQLVLVQDQSQQHQLQAYLGSSKQQRMCWQTLHRRLRTSGLGSMRSLLQQLGCQQLGTMVMLLLPCRATIWVQVGCQVMPAQAQPQRDQHSRLCWDVLHQVRSMQGCQQHSRGIRALGQHGQGHQPVQGILQLAAAALMLLLLLLLMGQRGQHLGWVRLGYRALCMAKEPRTAPRARQTLA